MDNNTEATFRELGTKLDCIGSKGVTGSNYKINKFNNYSDHYGLSGVFAM